MPCKTGKQTRLTGALLQAYQNMNMLSISRITLLMILLISCDDSIPFNSQKWTVEKDLENYPYRDRMLKDIINNKLFIGSNYQTIVDSLGQPENYIPRDEKELLFLIETDYGWDIDPVYVKHLVLTINKDSIIVDSEIREWERNSGEQKIEP